MSRNASGTYSLPAGNPVVTATVISSVWANTTLSDIATEMTDSLDRSGKGGMLAPLQLTDGAVGAPALTFVTDTTMGLYRISASTLGISTASTLRAQVNNNGKWDFSAPGDGTSVAMTVTGVNANVSVLTLTNSSLTSPTFLRWGRNGSTFDAYVGVAGAVNNILTGSAQGDFCIRNDSGALLLSANGSTIRGQCDSANLWKLWEGTVNVGTAALMNAATYEAGSFTATLTGCTTSPTQTVQYFRVGSIVLLNMSAGNLLGTSNTTACTFTGLPAALQPTRAQRSAVMLEDNTIFSIGSITLAAGSGTVTLVRGDNAAFTAAGTKGFVTFSCAYSLL